jgi:excisionase family DNA binding protein
VKHYTITEAAEKTGIGRHRILRLIKRGKIEAVKGEETRSPYQISEAELEKLPALEKSCDIEIAKNSQKKPEGISNITKPDYAQEGKYYEDFVQIQKILVETMRNLATTQEQIAATLRELVKKV